MKSPLNILFITAFPPNSRTAGQDYTCRLLDDLAGRGHSVSLVYASYPGHEAELDGRISVLSVIQPILKNCLNHPQFHPFFTRRLDRIVLSLIQSSAPRFDMLYFDFSQVHLYSLFVNHPNKVLMCHDVIAQKFSRKGRVQLPWIKRTEKAVLASASRILTFSRKDCDVIKAEYGFDSSAVHFYLKNVRFDYDSANVTVRENTFCFYGAWNRAENAEGLVWFLEKVLPLLSGTFRFLVIGGGMSTRLKKKLSAFPAAECLGFVEDPLAEIARCQALIAPLFKGAGVKVKVIDALTSGTGVIGTDVAFEGIEDNAVCRLFHKTCSVADFARILDSWKPVSASEKQAASDEFCTCYNSCRFADTV